MSDLNLIAFGCGISFITCAGVYVYVREGFLASERRRQRAARQAGEARSRRDEATSAA